MCSTLQTWFSRKIWYFAVWFFLMFLRQKMSILQERTLPFPCLLVRWWSLSRSMWLPFPGLRAGQRAGRQTLSSLSGGWGGLTVWSSVIEFSYKGKQKDWGAFPVLELWNSIVLIASGLWEGSPSVWPSVIRALPLSFSCLICETVMMYHTALGRDLMS